MDWYGHISEATDELRDELRRMYRLKKTPKDFGLAVRAHPDSLLVTARNKMRTAKEVTRIISLSAQSFESVELPSTSRDLERNFDKVKAFLAALRIRVGKGAFEGSVRVIRGATRDEVAGLLRSFAVPITEFRFQPDGIAELLERLEGDALNDWDVGIPGGDGDEVEVGGIAIKRQQRRMVRNDPPGVLVVSGSKRRVGSRGVEKTGLTEEQVAAARAAALADATQKAAVAGEPPPTRINVADRFFTANRSRPLLLIHVLEAKAPTEMPATRSDASLVAIGLAFPELSESSVREVKYKINLVKARELLSRVSEPGDDEDFQDDES